MRKYLGGLAVIAGLSGCASAELNYNTIDLASTTDDLMTKQVYHNLSNFIDSDLAYPTQLVINSGTATTSDTVSATYTDPLSKALQTTSQVVSTVAAATTVAGTRASQNSRASSSLGLGAQDVHSQLWSYQPVTDAFRAARLMALYRYVVDSSAYIEDSETHLKTDYPKIFRSVSHSRNDCLLDSSGKAITTDKPTDGIRPFSRCLNSLGTPQSGPSFTQGTRSFSSMEEDPYYKQGPGCVICQGGKINPDLSGGWLHWHALPGAPDSRRPDNYVAGDTTLGIHDHYEFFVRQGENLAKVPKFALFILAAATQSDTGSGGSAGGGSSSGGGGKGPPAVPLIDTGPGGGVLFGVPGITQ